jgi:hypothetical protein
MPLPRRAENPLDHASPAQMWQQIKSGIGFLQISCSSTIDYCDVNLHKRKAVAAYGMSRNNQRSCRYINCVSEGGLMRLFGRFRSLHIHTYIHGPLRATAHKSFESNPKTFWQCTMRVRTMTIRVPVSSSYLNPPRFLGESKHRFHSGGWLLDRWQIPPPPPPPPKKCSWDKLDGVLLLQIN